MIDNQAATEENPKRSTVRSSTLTHSHQHDFSHNDDSSFNRKSFTLHQLQNQAKKSAAVSAQEQFLAHP